METMSGNSTVEVSRPASTYSYRVYGIRLTSCLRLPCSIDGTTTQSDTELIEGQPDSFSHVPGAISAETDRDDWFRHVPLTSGWDYVGWTGLFEFLIAPDGRTIIYRLRAQMPGDAFFTYLISQTLSFALLKQGREPLHATVVGVHGKAIAFLGDCGQGKSSLAAAFLREGHLLLTDDLLVVSDSDGRLLAHPGPSRIKLYPDIARVLLGPLCHGVPINPHTPKLVIPLPSSVSSEAMPLVAMYVLGRGSGRRASEAVTLHSLSQRKAFLHLTENTFNSVIVSPERLTRQFELAGRLASRVPMKLLTYPRKLEQLPAVLDAVLQDMCR
jgi:hypothetical protein